ncbi:hypothetical protein RFI_40405 [Reticulomyxa filosa]|uniref:Uncharacterized protein n=1 Tax=Reticulomyxa filosa TaxID=46433 RepID=X6L759_RETFI|nr:hypothetical protein RFI_40405 [Reticulomyxa filosa]|eukprot:ETN97125.1 hypothetical protein RFI_40405 [Reticulomyxa filosa]
MPVPSHFNAKYQQTNDQNKYDMKIIFDINGNGEYKQDGKSNIADQTFFNNGLSNESKYLHRNTRKRKLRELYENEKYVNFIGTTFNINIRALLLLSCVSFDLSLLFDNGVIFDLKTRNWTEESKHIFIKLLDEMNIKDNIISNQEKQIASIKNELHETKLLLANAICQCHKNKKEECFLPKIKNLIFEFFGYYASLTGTITSEIANITNETSLYVANFSTLFNFSNNMSQKYILMENQEQYIVFIFEIKNNFDSIIFIYDLLAKIESIVDFFIFFCTIFKKNAIYLLKNFFYIWSFSNHTRKDIFVLLMKQYRATNK